MRIGLLGGLAAAGLLAACSGGGGGGGGGGALGGSCQAITGGGTQATRTGACATCSSANLGAAADGNVGTFAVLSHPSGAGGTNAVRVTAQPGIVYAAGTPAFVINAIDYEGESLQTSVRLQTYLEGVPQETTTAGSINGVGGPDEPVGRRGFTTTLPFDALELVYERAGGVGTVDVYVYEFCTN